MTTCTIRLHRVLRARPEKVYRAFLDPEAVARWLPQRFHLQGRSARCQNQGGRWPQKQIGSPGRTADQWKKNR